MPGSGAAIRLLIVLDWIREHRQERGGAPWDVYLTDPEKVADPADWRTEVIWRVGRRV